MTWISLSTGRKLDFVEPDPDSLSLENIVRSLCRTGRWANQTREFYSVAQHSVIVSQYVEHRGGSRHEQLVAMLHDAPEAYTGDACRPFKRMLGEAFKAIEHTLWTAMAIKFLGEPAEMSPLVKHCDDLALATEARDLFDRNPVDDWDYKLPDPDGKPIVPWSMGQAFAVFNARYRSLAWGIPEPPRVRAYTPVEAAAHLGRRFAPSKDIKCTLIVDKVSAAGIETLASKFGFNVFAQQCIWADDNSPCGVLIP